MKCTIRARERGESESERGREMVRHGCFFVGGRLTFPLWKSRKWLKLQIG